MDLTAQYAVAILMTSAGALLSAVYDVYRTSLREWRFLRRFAGLFDIAFWVFALIFVFTLLLGANDGDLRIVVFVLLAIGAFIYRRTAHPLVVASTALVVRFIYHVLKSAARLFMVLFVLPIMQLWRIVRWLWRLLDCLLAALEPIVAWPVVQTGRAFRFCARRAARWTAKTVRVILHKWQEKWHALSNRLYRHLLHWLRPDREEKSDDT